ncbi:MAG: DUF1304 domain-containing protein [Actinomycetota bacterium]
MGGIFVGISVIFHAYVFVLESISWTKPKTWKTFGLPNQEHADIIRPMALNQGFYNLFLALGAGVGLALLGGNKTVAPLAHLTRGILNGRCRARFIFQC